MAVMDAATVKNKGFWLTTKKFFNKMKTTNIADGIQNL